MILSDVDVTGAEFQKTDFAGTTFEKLWDGFDSSVVLKTVAEEMSFQIFR